MRLHRSVDSPLAPAQVFDFISDFETTEQWDPGTVSTRREHGDGGIGTTYRNVSQFRGRRNELIYTVTDYARDEFFALHGVGKSIEAHDQMRLTATTTGTRLDYVVSFHLRGILRPFSGVLLLFRRDFERLADEGQAGLSRALASTDSGPSGA